MLIRSALGAADKRRIQAMLFANNGGSGLRQALLDGAPFLAELTHSLVLQRGTGSPTFTRATTETGQKWDESGYLDFTALAGEIVFKGARRERNLAPASEDLTNAGYPASNLTKAAGVLTETTANGLHYISGIFGVSGAKAQMQMVVSNAVGGTRGLWIGDGTNNSVFNLATGTVRSNSGNATGFITPTGNPREYLCYVNFTAGTTASYFGLTQSDGTTSYAGSVSNTLNVSKVQYNDITGETDQTTIRPYVSVGVASAPSYHGSMVDGVKCYDTDRSGNPISTTGSYPLVGYVPWEARTNLALQSNAFTTAPWGTAGTPSLTKNAVGVDGFANSAWTVTVSQGDEYNQLSATLTAAIYTRSIKIKKTTGAQTAYPIVTANGTGGTVIALATINTSTGVGTLWTSYVGWTIASNAAVRVTSYNADFWLVELSFTATVANWAVGYIGAMTTNATKSSGSFADADITGAAGTHVMQDLMLELGSFASPYQPTTTVAVARNASVLTYTGADVANIKTLAATFSRGVGVGSSGWVVGLSDGTTSNISGVRLTSATDLNFAGNSGGVSQWNTSTTPAYTSGATSKTAASTATNDIKMAKDGVAQTQDTTATPPTVTQLQVGHLTGLYQLQGNVGGIYGWTRNLSQSELNAITS